MSLTAVSLWTAIATRVTYIAYQGLVDQLVDFDIQCPLDVETKVVSFLIYILVVMAWLVFGCRQHLASWKSPLVAMVSSNSLEWLTDRLSET